jgi:hypothetical protein
MSQSLTQWIGLLGWLFRYLHTQAFECRVGFEPTIQVLVVAIGRRDLPRVTLPSYSLILWREPFCIHHRHCVTDPSPCSHALLPLFSSCIFFLFSLLDCFLHSYRVGSVPRWINGWLYVLSRFSDGTALRTVGRFIKAKLSP